MDDQLLDLLGNRARLVFSLYFGNLKGVQWELEQIGNLQRLSNFQIAISFTVETDGDLPSGIRLRDAVETIDAATDSGPVYYLINCAHPSHFGHAFGS